MSSSWKTDVWDWFLQAVEIISLIVFSSMFLGMFLMAYIAIRHLDEIFSSMKNSRGVACESRYYKTWGLEQRCRFILTVGAMVRRPTEKLLVSGDVCRGDIQNLRGALRRLLCVQDYLCINSFWGCLAMAVVLKLLDYLE